MTQQLKQFLLKEELKPHHVENVNSQKFAENQKQYLLESQKHRRFLPDCSRKEWKDPKILHSNSPLEFEDQRENLF